MENENGKRAYPLAPDRFGRLLGMHERTSRGEEIWPGWIYGKGGLDDCTP